MLNISKTKKEKGTITEEGKLTFEERLFVDQTQRVITQTEVTDRLYSRADHQSCIETLLSYSLMYL